MTEQAPASEAPTSALAATLVELIRKDTTRTFGGIIASIVDARHVLVDAGDQAVTAMWAESLGAPEVGLSVRVLVSGGVAEVLSTRRAPAPPVTPVPYRMASESATLSFSSSGTASVNVTFPAGRFTVAPRFMAYIRSPDLRVIISATNESITGGRINGAVVGTMTGSVSVGWLAWQMTPTSKD